MFSVSTANRGNYIQVADQPPEPSSTLAAFIIVAALVFVVLLAVILE